MPDFDNTSKGRGPGVSNGSRAWLVIFLATSLVALGWVPEMLGGRGRGESRAVSGPNGEAFDEVFDIPMYELAWNKARLEHMDAYDRSGLKELQVGKRIAALASQHGFLPDALLDICRMAYVQSTLSARGDAAQGDAQSAWESVEEMITKSLVREYLRNHAKPASTFLKELTQIRWDQAASEALFNCCLTDREGEGKGTARLADERIKELLDPLRHPAFDLEPDWFISQSDAWGVQHLQQLENLRKQIPPGFTEACQQRMARLLTSMQIPECDLPLLVRRGLEHIHTRGDLNSLIEESEPIWFLMGPRAETERLFHHARLTAFEAYVEASWDSCLGSQGRALAQSVRDWDRVLGVVGADTEGVRPPGSALTK